MFRIFGLACNDAMDRINLVDHIFSDIFIGPRSDHSLPMSLTDWLTDKLEDWMNWLKYADYADCADYADYVEYADYADYADYAE